MRWWGGVYVAGIALMFGFGAGLGPLLSPLLYTLTPLQRYYLTTYMASAWDANEPGATTEVRWAEKVRPEQPPEGKPETKAKPGRGRGAKNKAGRALDPAPTLAFYLAQERDLVPKSVAATVWSGDALPFLLSEEAAREGWTGLEHGSRQHVESAKLYAALRDDYFDGRRWESFFLQPLLAAATLVLLGLVARAWLLGRRDRHLWGRPLTRRELLWTWMFEPPEKTRMLAGRPVPRQIEAAVAPSQPKAAAPVQAAPRAAAAPLTEAKAPFVWDESMGID